MPWFILFFLLLMIGYTWLINFYSKGWKKLPEWEGETVRPNLRLSVIIPLRNEEENINRLVNCLSAQNLPQHHWEVIFIDDHSTDSTWTQLAALSNLPFSFAVYRLQDLITPQSTPSAFKKLAIEKGIEKASGELIVTTDADCCPPPQWLLTLAAFYTATNASFIAAPVKFTAPKTVLGIFQQLDFLILQGITAASVYLNFHTMCNGANLAYPKRVFEAVGGFSGIDQLPTGDDMLLMHKVYTQFPDKIYFLKNKNVIMPTPAMGSWKKFFEQRIRWASKATFYKDKRIFYVLLGVYLLNFSFLVLLIAGFFQSFWWFFMLLFLFGKILIEWPFVATVSRFFGQISLLMFFPLLQPIHIIYTIIAGWLGKFGTYEWKGRKIKKGSTVK